MGAQMGLQIIGSTLQAMAAAKAQQKMFDTYKRYQSMAAQQQKAGMKEWQANLPEYAAPAESRLPLYSMVGGVPLGYGSPASRDVTTAYSMLAQPRANLMQYGDDAFLRALQTATGQRGLDYRAVLAGGQQSPMPYSMYKAQHSKDAMALAGMMISQLGGQAPQLGTLFNAPQQGWGQSQFTAPSNSALAPEMYGPGMM